VRFVEDEVRTFNEHSSGRPNIRPLDAKPRKIGEYLCFGFYRIEDAFSGGRIIATDLGIDLDQIFPCLRGPEKINWQGLYLLR
jgi:hypothetical protein